MKNVAELRSLIREILLMEWDPIGIAEFPEAHDEYNEYVAEVEELVAGQARPEVIFAYLWKLETTHMGLVGDRPKTERIASRLSGLIAPTSS